jgi:hypothetical protein
MISTEALGAEPDSSSLEPPRETSGGFFVAWPCSSGHAAQPERLVTLYYP